MADTKLVDLDPGNAEGTDIVYAVKDPSGVPLDRKIALSNIKDYILGGSPPTFTDAITVRSTDTGATAAPDVILYRDSASPADNDIIGQIKFDGEDSAGNQQTYGTITGQILDEASTSEDGALLFGVVTAGTVANEVRLDGSALSPATSDGNALGTSSLMWSDLFLASGGVVNFNNGDVTITHGADTLTVAGGDLRSSTAGTDTASVVTVGGTQTLTNKTLTSPTLTTPVLGTPASGTLTNCTGFSRAAINDFRLTLSTGAPVPSSVSSATSVFLTPYIGNAIGLWNGTTWQVVTSAEVSNSLSGAAANTNFDVFAFLNSGSLAIERLAWTNNTTRTTAVAYDDGVLIKSGDKTRRYVGTIRTTATTGQCEDSVTKRYVWNANNRVIRPMRVLGISGSTQHTYTTLTWRQMDANTSYQLDFVLGRVADAVNAACTVTYANSTAGKFAVTSIGLNSTASPVSGCLTANMYTSVANIAAPGFAMFSDLASEGYNYLAWLEIAEASGTATWFLASQGIKAEIMA